MVENPGFDGVGSPSLAPPRVSVGMPVRNGEPYVEEALECLRRQTFRDFEVLIADNASTDRTPEIARAFAARDPRFRFVPAQVDRGAAWNFNRCVRLARGPYFRWAASDDLVAPEFLERAVGVLDEKPDVVLAYPKTLLIDAEGRVTAPYEDRLHLVQERPSDRLRGLWDNLGLCNAPYGLIRREALLETPMIAGFPGGSVVFLGALALRGKFWEIPEPLFMRRFHAAAASAKTGDALTAHYDPTNPGPGEAAGSAPPQWPRFVAALREVVRAPVPLSEKLRGAGYLLRRMAWGRDELTREIGRAIRGRAGSRS